LDIPSAQPLGTRLWKVKNGCRGGSRGDRVPPSHGIVATPGEIGWLKPSVLFLAASPLRLRHSSIPYLTTLSTAQTQLSPTKYKAYYERYDDFFFRASVSDFHR
jgi:hypothetical protein